jgi:hypothetical protein
VRGRAGDAIAALTIEGAVPGHASVRASQNNPRLPRPAGGRRRLSLSLRLRPISGADVMPRLLLGPQPTEEIRDDVALRSGLHRRPRALVPGVSRAAPATWEPSSAGGTKHVWPFGAGGWADSGHPCARVCAGATCRASSGDVRLTCAEESRGHVNFGVDEPRAMDRVASGVRRRVRTVQTHVTWLQLARRPATCYVASVGLFEVPPPRYQNEKFLQTDCK